MTTQKPDHGIRRRLDQLTHRMWELAGSGESRDDGLVQVAVGLSALLENFSPEDHDVPRVERLLDGLEALTDMLRGSGEEGSANGAPVAEGLDRFIGAFQAEAQKRLAGLSISMMGIFNSESPEKAIDQSTGHLHAIRGGAAMLGLDPIASLASAMEEVILATRRLDPESRSWPVKPLLQGYSLLKSAVENPYARENEMLRATVTELQRSHTEISAVERPSVGARTAARNEFTDGPVTNVRSQPLEKRILIVDDVETIAASVGMILSELDIPIDVARDGEEALQKLRDYPYSLVISDVAMPRLDGLELTRRMREDESLTDIPIILLTALDKEQERQQGLDAGATDYIVKGSIGGGELIARVNELLQEAPYVPALATPPDRPLRILVAEDTETVAASIAFVLSEGPYEIVLAHDGKDAWHRLRNERFDLIISDLQMPSMNGIELIRAVRADEALRELPIVLLTAQKSDEDQRAAAAAGADRYLIKGEIGAGRLLEVVSEILEKTLSTE